MRRDCPKCLIAVATLRWGAAVVLMAGCSSGQQSGVPNPFMSADRVPPPGTRLIPQGTAQPYYPTSPVPPAQGAIPPATTPWTGGGQSDITPIPGNSFSSASTPSASNFSTSTPNDSLGSEPAIAVPTDGADLRFAALPTPSTRLDVAPLAGASVPAVTGTLPPRGSTSQPTTLAAGPTSIATSPAMASTPLGTSGPQVTLTPIDNPAPDSTFPEPSPPGGGGQTAPVPFPSDIPRIRLPHGGVPAATSAQGLPAGVQTMSYQIELPPAGVAPTAPPLSPPAVTPPAGYTAAPTQLMVTPSASGVVPASYQAELPPASIAPDGFRPPASFSAGAEQQQAGGVAPATFASSTIPGTGQQAYAYGASYEWLQGRLEYSAVHGYWTLRYMPLGGPSDSFGGHVVIANSDVLAGYHPGDFVTVQGQLVALGADPSLGVAYSVYTIQRQ